jgi:hypothetical protein
MSPRYRREQHDTESSPSIWKDLSSIKLGYLVLLGVCVVGGTIYRANLDSDDAGLNARTSGEFKPAPANYIQVQNRNTRYIEGINLGVSRAEVVQSLGQPDFRQWYDNGFELFMYRVESVANDNYTTKNETASLIFEEGELVGYNESGRWFDTTKVYGGSSQYESRQNRNKQLISDLETGASRTSIIDSLGLPNYVDYPGHGFEILSFRTQHVASDDLTSRDETTPILLEDGSLVAKGIIENAGRTEEHRWHNTQPTSQTGPEPSSQTRSRTRSESRPESRSDTSEDSQGGDVTAMEEPPPAAAT